jgi:D-alanyl-lipoteichoic acid acyltransferase DltB (MBOAT superfamily)
MLFNSIAFIIFIFIVFIIYPRLQHRQQNLFLLVASYVFYGYWDWRFNFLLLSSTIINFWIGRLIHASRAQGQRKRFLIASVVVNLGVLGFFKYCNFFLDSAASLLLSIGFQPNMPVLRVILPVGISFYTFQTMSYTIDIYRGKLEPTRTFLDFALFVAFFPQLVAGPIERARNLLPQIAQPRHVCSASVVQGLNLVLLGYFKKVAIADTLAPIVEGIFVSPEAMSSGQLWTGMYAFTFQIYGDFSGYTDIARGIAKMLGFELMENFNAPYLSRNISEFWRRWHISLSTWLRDYLYIPLGGNRIGKIRTYINLLLTMLLGGLWHGAAWNFVWWGLLHGIYLAVHRLLFGDGKPGAARLSVVPGWVVESGKIFLTFHVVGLTWIFFRSSDLGNAFIYFQGLCRLHEFTGLSFNVVFAGCLMMLLDIAQVRVGSHTWLTDRRDMRLIRYAVAQLLFVSVITASIAHIQTVTPFIYFQF